MAYSLETIMSQLQEGECELFFRKKNGSIRHMICTLNANYVPLFYKPKVMLAGSAPQPESPTGGAVVPVWDTEKMDWRSFRINSVLFFKKKDSFYPTKRI